MPFYHLILTIANIFLYDANYKAVQGGIITMSTTTDKFSALYRITMSLIIDKTIISIPTADIISISFINNYDALTFPIIRIRLYADISIMENLAEAPDKIFIRTNFDGGIYRMNDTDKTPIIISPIKNIAFSMKCYIENKNNPTSTADQYVDGIKKKNDLNTDIKVPIELYCYDEYIIHRMKQKAPSIYKNMSISSVIEDMLYRSGITNYNIEPLQNQAKYDQILIPNLNISQALSLFDVRYGMYEKGALLYGDIDKLYLCDTNVDNNTTPLPIYVNSYKNNNDMGGMKLMSKGYYMSTMATNVSILSETDIERVLNTTNMVAVNINTLNVESCQLKKLYDIQESDKNIDKISTTDILHKNQSDFIAETNTARINERITKIDISGVGFDIGKMKSYSRYNLIFESPMRGASMNQVYRPIYTCHVLSNMGSSLFVAQTTMTLCNN
jgi:hypothetical protein